MKINLKNKFLYLPPWQSRVKFYESKFSKKIRLEIREKFHFEIWANFDHPKFFNSVKFRISNDAELTLMLWPLKQAITRENRWSLSKVMDYLVRPCIAGNAKKMQNWSTLPRDFSATAGDKNSRLVPKLVLRHALFGNTYLGPIQTIWKSRENFVSIIFILSHKSRNGKKQPASRKKGALH